MKCECKRKIKVKSTPYRKKNISKMDSTLQNSSTISEQKYINLRKRLDQLGYRQTLGIESLPLIEKLFNDLVHTTESLKKSKLEVSLSAFFLLYKRCLIRKIQLTK